MARKRRTTTTTTTTPTTSTPIPAPATVRRGTRMGISAGAYLPARVVDAAVDLGVSWVRCSVESGWANALQSLAASVDYAHRKGIKVIHSVQNSGHSYHDPAANDRLVTFAVDTVRVAHVDCVEVGNEWNHAMFWKSPDVNIVPPVAQANLSTRIGSAVRTAYPLVPVITNGMSPEAEPLNPWTWWPTFLDAALPAQKATGWNGIGLHGFCYPELATTNPARWNPLMQIPTIVQQSRDRGITTDVWITEIGAPGFAINPPVVRGIALTEQRQLECWQAYIDVIHDLERGGIRLPNLEVVTAFDGDSATTGVELGFGLIRADLTRKPAWALVRSFADEIVPA